jgi:hypothetical protein
MSFSAKFPGDKSDFDFFDIFQPLEHDEGGFRISKNVEFF